MSDASFDLVLHLVARHETEGPPLEAAREQLVALLRHAISQPANISLSRGPPDLIPAPGAVPRQLILSMMHEAFPPYDPIAMVSARWHRLMAGLADEPLPVLLCNIFRHVPADPFGPEGMPRDLVLHRIRQLNLLAVALSHDHAADLADIDHHFALLGGRLLQTGFRLRGTLGAAVSGDVITGALLQGGLESLLPAAALQAAQAQHGGQAGIAERVQHFVEWQAQQGGGRDLG